jgi:hypothetical protein
MRIHLPQQDTGYVVRDLYCLPHFNYVHLNSSSPFLTQHPILNLKHPFDEDSTFSHSWDSSACLLGPPSCLVRTLSPF